MNNRGENILNDDRIGHLLFKLSLPAFVGMFVMTLYNVVDTIFVGHYVGSLGIAGLSIVFPIQMLAMGMGLMTGMGGASLISRLIGAGNTSRAERALGNAVAFTVAISTVVAIAGLLNIDQWLTLMGASDTILPYARDYMWFILIGLPFKTFAMAQNSLIRAEGNARVPMTGMIMGAVLNIILDAVFMIQLDMGIKGAALATLLAQVVSCLYLASYHMSGKSFLRIHWNNLIIQRDILKAILAIGIAAFAMQAAGSVSAIFINRSLGTLGGDLAVSAYGLVNRVMMFVLMPSVAIGQGLQPILGFNCGAKEFGRALRAIRIAIVSATICATIVFLALQFAPAIFVRVFTADNELVVLGAHAVRRVFFTKYSVGFVVVGSMIFQAMGKAPQAFITAIARSALFLLPLVFILPNYWHLDGVWLAFPITDVLAFILVLILLIPQINMFRKNAIRQV